MPRRPPVGLALAALLLGGCTTSDPQPASGPVPVTPPPLSATSARVCADVVAALPQRLGDAARREVEPRSTSTAAWGDPAIVLTCGAVAGDPRDDDYEFDGVPWSVHDTGASRTWTTRGRPVLVQVVVPDAYSGQAELLGSLATALAPTAR